MSVIIFLGVLFVLVLVHEWGHYITAKLTGMRVDEFGIGFPPKLFGIKKGETEYTFNALPIGGFVKIYGEDKDTIEAKGDYDRSFVGKSKWAQALVLVAGVAMNVVFAWILFSGAYMSGVERQVDEENAGPGARLIVTDVLPGSPADAALLPSGVVLTAVSRSGEQLTSLTPSSFSAFVGKSADYPVEVMYTKEDKIFITSIQPVPGTIESEPTRPAIGVALSLVEKTKYSFFAALKEGFFKTIESTVAITVGIAALIKDALLGEADLSQVAGPVGIVGLVGEASAYGFSALLMFTAFISLNLAVINLLPFPALDGGRLLFVGIESITGKSVSPRATQIINTAGFFILILLMIVVTWSDISKLL